MMSRCVWAFLVHAAFPEFSCVFGLRGRKRSGNKQARLLFSLRFVTVVTFYMVTGCNIDCLEATQLTHSTRKEVARRLPCSAGWLLPAAAALPALLLPPRAARWLGSGIIGRSGGTTNDKQEDLLFMHTSDGSVVECKIMQDECKIFIALCKFHVESMSHRCWHRPASSCYRHMDH